VTTRAAHDMTEPVVAVERLGVRVSTGRAIGAFLAKRQVEILQDVSFEIRPGEILGLAGESGSGKSTVASVLTGMMPVSSGEVTVHGTSIKGLSHSGWRPLRRAVQPIFQDPFDSLNPHLTVAQTVAQPLRSLQACAKGDIAARVRDALHHAELRPAEEFLNRLPNDLSGGQRQRVSIARALVLNPEIIIADEPVSMLDSSTAWEIAKLFRRLADELQVAILLISHDLALLASVCDRIGIMYLGRLIELGTAADVMRRPSHPYTRLLKQAIPSLDISVERPRVALSGPLPTPADRPPGCAFHPRCPLADRGQCETVTPTMPPGPHSSACHLTGVL
jgi:oligopeptide/dipeptide ABC transporter ATP-binding protein